MTIAAFVIGALVTAFVVFWVAAWRVQPDEYPNAETWWREFATPWLLVAGAVGVPVGAASAVVVRMIRIRRGRQGPGDPFSP